MHSADFIGLFGVLLVLIAYFLLQTGRMGPFSLSYSGLNTIGSLMIIYSLFYKWNLSAFAMEATWLILSLYGVYKNRKARHLQQRGN